MFEKLAKENKDVKIYGVYTIKEGIEENRPMTVLATSEKELNSIIHFWEGTKYGKGYKAVSHFRATKRNNPNLFKNYAYMDRLLSYNNQINKLNEIEKEMKEEK